MQTTGADIAAFLGEHFMQNDRHEPYPEALLQEYLELGALHHFIPVELGGKFESAVGLMDFVELTSFHSLPLGLALGISGSLFLRPVVLHATPEIRDPIVDTFLSEPALGGLMLTEPTGGTDVAAFRTSYAQDGNWLTINGAKCWGGLTGKATHWLVAARLERRGELTNRLALVYVPLETDGIHVETYFDALGLQPIPYGETRYTDTRIPAANIVALPGESPTRAIYDTLFRSRMGLPAISAGHCHRMAHEAELRAGSRRLAGGIMADYDQVQFRLADLRGLYELTHSLGRFTGGWMDAHEDITADTTLANTAKIICTETMSLASDSALQLFASAGYKRNHVVGRGFVDSRAFRIFEGVNDVLDDAIYETIKRRRGAFDAEAVQVELAHYGLHSSHPILSRVLEIFDRPVARQRHRVAFGRIFAWLMSLCIAENAVRKPDRQREEAVLVAVRKIAEGIATLPYLGTVM